MSSQTENIEPVDGVEEKPKSIPVYIKNENGELVANPEWEVWARSLYYNGRLCYENDNRFPVGRYDSEGEVIRFQRWSTDNVTVA